MNFRKNIKPAAGQSFIVFIMLLLIACAQVVSPTGGDKDTASPKISKSTPENFSTGFKGNSLTLTFDEYVQLKDLNSQLIISPPLSKKPSVKLKGKSLILQFNEDLLDSTTYSFNFGKSIVDLNEGNPLDSNLFVFSTGYFLDSLSVSGIVKNASDAKPEKDVAVMLYAYIEDSIYYKDTTVYYRDSIPYKEQPLYISRTKEDGTYALNNIKAGRYVQFALKDLNNNLLYDQPGELISFSDSLLILDTANRIVNMNLFEEKSKKQFIKKAYAEQYGKFTFEFNLPVDRVSITPLNHSFKKAWFLEQTSLNRDTISYWLTDIEGMDSLALIVNDYKTIQDTFEIAIGKKETNSKGIKKGRASQSKPLLLDATFNAGRGVPLDLNNNLTINFSHPIASYDFSKVILSRGDDTLTFKTRVLDTISREFQIMHSWQEDSLYKLFIPSGTFIDIFNLSNDTIINEFKFSTAESYGTIMLTLTVPKKQHQFIIELSKDKQSALRTQVVKHNETVEFLFLNPGAYNLKITYDENNNGKWDTGDYMDKRQPEKVVYYTSAITVRPNWDMDLEWIVEGELERGVNQGPSEKDLK